MVLIGYICSKSVKFKTVLLTLQQRDFYHVPLSELPYE